MIIKYEYSHLNGLEHLMVHKPQLLEEIRSAIAAIDANQHTKTSKDKTKTGKTLSVSNADVATKATFMVVVTV
jgi:hypothetical protein